MRIQTGFGRYVTGETDVICTPQAGVTFSDLYNPTKRGVLFFHGGGGNAYHVIYPNDTNQTAGKIARTLTDAGYAVTAGDDGGPWVFGNPTMRSRATSLKTYMQSLGARSGKIHAVGVSMGAVGALNWAAENPSLVASIIILLPVIDMNYVHANNINGVAGFIDAAYGGTYVDANERATSNPAYMATAAGGNKYDGIPIQLWRATDDVYCPDSIYQQFALDADLCELRSLGANGHTDFAIAQTVWGDMVTFLTANDGPPDVPGPPDQVTGLTANASFQQVALSWTAPPSNGSPITDYIIEQSLAGAGSWSTFADGTSTATNTIVTGLTNGIAYDFRVSAVNGLGTGPVSTTVSATPIASFVFDSFTGIAGTLLQAHTPEVGGVPAKHTAATCDLLITDANRLRSNDAANFTTEDGVYYYPATPASAEYDVSAIIVRKGGGGSASIMIHARGDSASASLDAYRVVVSNGDLSLYKTISGATTVLGTYAITLADDTPVTILFQVRDANKKVFVDGVERISSTDNDITRVGKVGIQSRNINTNAVGLHTDSLSAQLAGPPILLDSALTRLEDDIVVAGVTGPNPWLRNTNTAGTYDEQKAGTRMIRRESTTAYKMWWESLEDGSPLINAACFASSTNGIDWIKYNANPVLSATEPWENSELAPTTVLWDGSQYIMYYHGGNNPPGVRYIGRATSLDGLVWTKYAGNPIMGPGPSGAFDEQWVADAKVVRVSASSWIMLYRADNNANVSRIGRATSTDGINWTKDGTTANIDFGGAAWESNGVGGPSIPYIDANGRWHLWYCGIAADLITQSLGYAYSDNQGATWTKGAGNPVISGNPEADAPDKVAGDVLDATHDGDKLLISYGGFSFGGDYTGTGGTPIRGICASYLPLKINAPSIPARFFEPSSQVVLPASVSLLDNATFTIIVRAKVYRDNEYRELYTEQAAFNESIFLRLGNDGKLTMFYRSPAAIASFDSAARFDDNQWHTFAMRRNSSASFDLIADGVVLGSSTNDPGTVASVPGDAPTYGNWAASSGLNEPLLGSISRIAVWDTAALSLAEITAFAANSTLPGAGTPAWWHDPGTSSPETDKSGNGNPGTVTGTTIVNGDALAGVTP